MLPDYISILLCHSWRQMLWLVRAVCLHVGVPSAKLGSVISKWWQYNNARNIKMQNTCQTFSVFWALYVFKQLELHYYKTIIIISGKLQIVHTVWGVERDDTFISDKSKILYILKCQIRPKHFSLMKKLHLNQTAGGMWKGHVIYM